MVQIYGSSDIGLVRPNNEDVYKVLKEHLFFTLADGMGGHNAGEIAAKEAIDTLCTSIKYILEKRKSQNFKTHEIILNLKRSIDNANRKVFSLGNMIKSYQGMGTTLCCMHIYKHKLFYAHVGDSRIYLFRNNKLTQLTKDHSFINDCTNAQLIKKISKEKNIKNIITKAIGTHLNVEPSISITNILSDDIFFMCSDGLSDYLHKNEISEILFKTPSIEVASEKLIETAKKNQSSDNITVVMLKIPKNYETNIS